MSKWTPMEDAYGAILKPFNKQRAIPMNRPILALCTLILICSIALAPINKQTIPPIDFPSDHYWVEVPEGTSDPQLKHLIRNEVIRLIDQNEQPVAYEKSIDIYRDWLKEKQELNDLWNGQMIELGTRLRNQIAKVNDIRQEKISLQHQIEIKQSLLESLTPTLKNDSLALHRHQNEKEYLKANLEVQLKDISYQIAMFGKQQLGVIANLPEVRAIITDRMMMDARRHVYENYIESETAIQDNQIIQSSFIPFESYYTQVLDPYANGFTKPSGGRDVLYLMQVIEVNPFSSGGSKRWAHKSPPSEAITHILTQRNIDQIWRDNDLTSDPTKTPIRDYIFSVIGRVDSHNRGNNAKIRKLNNTYQEQLSEINNKIAAAENDLLLHNNQLMQAQLDIAALTDSYSQPTSSIAVDSLEKVYEAYRNHYNLRVTLTDITEEGFLKKSREEEYIAIASSTVDRIKECKEGEYINTMMVVNPQLNGYSPNLLSYSPVVRAFTILFLTRKELSGDDNYSASVGYQIAWEPITTPLTALTAGGTVELFPGPLADMQFVNIPGGDFLMGSPENESGRDANESPQHRVMVKTFNMMTTEVTQAQWVMVMSNNPSYFPGDNLPVENVSYNDCQWFIAQLNQMDSGKGYRLPTEAEWEYACRAGTSTRFFNGNDDLDLKKVSWFVDNSNSRTHPVGTKEPNVSGLHDMHGNLWEWCEDRYHDSYDGAPANGAAWVSGDNDNRVIRGGSWGDNTDDCRSARRNQAGPDDSSSNIGFRIVYNP